MVSPAVRTGLGDRDMSLVGPGGFFQRGGEGSGRVRSGTFCRSPKASGSGEIRLLETSDASRSSAVYALCLPKGNLPCWPKGQRVGAEAGGQQLVEISSRERGGQQADFGFLGPLSGSCRGCRGLCLPPLEVWAAGGGQHLEREASHLSWAGRCPGPGPSEQDGQGEQGQQEQQRAWGGAA